MSAIVFRVQACSETSGYVARWDDPQGGGIKTRGETVAELHWNIAGAVKGYFKPGEHPQQVQLRFVDDPIRINERSE
jgi:predicted RNase H-like HicB family nuclease